MNLNRNVATGLALVIAAGAFTCIFAASEGCVVERLVGKAVWYLPYAAFVGGISRLARAGR